MAMPLVALGVATPNIDPVGAAQDARSVAINQQGAKLQQEAQAFEQVAQMGLGVMGGKLDGPVDPTRLSQMVTMMGDNPVAQQLKDHPELLPVITRGSINVLQAANNANEFELRKQQLAADLQKTQAELQKAKFVEVSPGATLHDTSGATADFTAPNKNPTGTLGEYQTYVEQEKAAGRVPLSLMDYQMALKGNGVTVTGPDGSMIQVGGTPKANNAYDIADSQRLVKLGGTIADEGRKAQTTLATLGKMKDLLANDQVYTGIGAEQIKSLQQAGIALGITDPSAIKDTESFNALAKQAVLDTMGGSLGTGFSNADRDFVIAQVPNLANTKQGNLQLVDIQSKIAQRKVDIAKFTADYKKAHNGRLDGNFDGELSAWAEQHPLFDQQTTPNANVPTGADETKTVDGVTYYRKGIDWYKVD